MTVGRFLRPLSALPPAGLCLALALSACQGPPPQSGGAGARKRGEDYIAALAAADQFCDAWRRSDTAAGKAILSVRIKRTFPDARIADAIAGTSNPLHAAFEIHDGQSLDGGGFAFPLRLFYRYAGQAEDRIEGPLEQIVVRQGESGRWVVDRFPLLADPNTRVEVIRSQ